LRPFHPTLGSHKKLLTYIFPSSSNFLFIPCNQSDNYYNQCYFPPSQSEYPMSNYHMFLKVTMMCHDMLDVGF
jgi:hypothetical protein